MDNYVDERDHKLLEADKYTFSVLSRIMGGECSLCLSDHQRLIICFTGHPFPVWIWTPDNANSDEKEQAYAVAKEHSLLDGNHRFNMKYDLAEYFVDRAKKDGMSLTITTNMFAYDCPSLIVPKTATDGQVHKCTADDIDVLVDFYDLFHNAVGIDKQDRDQYRLSAEKAVQFGTIYLWLTAEGQFATSCNWHPVKNMASIGLVYTREEYRRRHYAEHLVYHVSRIAMDEGFLPMLYTDADYVASNKCYEKIGFVMRGKLCTIEF